MNPYGDDLIVDQVIGSAYQVVKYVASNMATLIELSDFIQFVSKEGLLELIEAVPELTELHAHLTELLAIHANLAELLALEVNLPMLTVIYNMLPELQEIYDNLPAILDSSLSVATSREAIVRSYNEAGYPMDKTESFEASGTITTAKETLLYEQNGVGYSWGGALPKSVPAGSTPSTTGGIGPTAWIDQSTKLLRQQLIAMSGNLNPAANWSDIPMHSDPELGGPDGPMNVQAEALAARTEQLRIDMRDMLQTSASIASYTGELDAVTITTEPHAGLYFRHDAYVGGTRTGLVLVDGLGRKWVRYVPSIAAEAFGVDPTGTIPSDTQLLDALNYSAATGIEVVIHGAVRITKTLNQPLNSVVRCDGVVFCTDGALLTDGWMWVVDAAGNHTKLTEIRTLTLSTTANPASFVDLPIKGLKVSTPKVRCGTIRTYGLIMGGVEFGPIGYEITADEISNVAKAWTPASRGTPGLKITTTDCMVQRHFCVGYSIGGNYGSASYIGAAHVWGFPATSTNQYPNQQMLTGVMFGASTVVDYIYADTIDTESYDALPSDNDGYCVVFVGWENKLNTLLYVVHNQTKAAKTKIIKFNGKSCEVKTLIKSSGSNSTADPAIDYDLADGRYGNIIQQLNGVKSNNINYGTTLVPNGFITFTGYQVVRTFDRMFETRIYHNVTAVDASPTTTFAIPLPSGLIGTQGATGIASQHSCFNLGTIDANIGDVFAILDGSGVNINFCYVRKDTGAQVFIKQNQLRAGALQVILYSANGNY